MNDLQRRLENWGRWRREEGGLRSIGRAWAMSAIYACGPRGARAGVSMVVLVGEAVDTDRAIARLDAHLQRVLEVRYVKRTADDREAARLAACSVSTFARRLDHACFLLASAPCKGFSGNPLVT